VDDTSGEADVKTAEPDQALCVGQPALFELSGKNPAQIRQAADLCRRCPLLVPCRADAAGTTDMIRAGRVYSRGGVAYHPEFYIRRWYRAYRAARTVARRTRVGMR
jgi:hypothetical protein